MKTSVYCSFCSLPHKVYTQKHVTLPALIAFAFISVLVTYAAWEAFHWVGCLIFLMLATWGEMVYRLRWRRSVNCKSCGFDPFVYKQSKEAAAMQVKDFLDNRRTDPNFLLRTQPLLKPTIKKVDHRKWLKDFDAPN